MFEIRNGCAETADGMPGGDHTAHSSLGMVFALYEKDTVMGRVGPQGITYSLGYPAQV
jgi:hypothetical protein